MSTVELTERAATKVRTMLQGDPANAGHGLRIGVDPGGCAGYQYSLQLAAEPEDGERTLPQEGFDVFVHSAMMPLLRGMRIDYVESLTSSGFTFDNPNAGGGCGCGSSFTATAQAEEDVALTVQVREAMEEFVRPYLRSEGGDVTVVDVVEGVVRVRLTGACGGCSMANGTVTAVIERRLMDLLPQVRRVALVA